MPTITSQLDSTIQSFVTEISSLVRVAALEAVRDALGGGGGATPARRVPGRPKGTAKTAMAARPTRGGRRARRSGADVQATAEKMLAYVKANDGKRLDEIAKGLGTDTASLTRPSLLLLESKAVKRSGQRRGTKYHIGTGAMSKAVAAPAAPEATPTKTAAAPAKRKRAKKA